MGRHHRQTNATAPRAQPCKDTCKKLILHPTTSMAQPIHSGYCRKHTPNTRCCKEGQVAGREEWHRYASYTTCAAVRTHVKVSKTHSQKTNTSTPTILANKQNKRPCCRSLRWTAQACVGREGGVGCNNKAGCTSMQYKFICYTLH